MNKLRTKRTTHRPKSEPLEPEVIDSEAGDESPSIAFKLLYDASGLPVWEGVPDPAQMYSWAIREMVILGRLCPDLDVRFNAIKFLAQEFCPQVPPETDEERERRAAVLEIEGILRTKGIGPPLQEPIELETTVDGN